jgi:hypothetical protein
MLKTTITIKKKIKNVVRRNAPAVARHRGIFFDPSFAAQEEANHE